MKKIFVIPAVIAMTFISCSKDQEIETEDKIIPGEEIIPGEGVTVFEVELPETKVHLGEPTGSVGSRSWPLLWSDGDVIDVNGVKSNALSDGDGYVGTNYAQFTMKGTVYAPYCAAYPGSAVSDFEDGFANITVPSNQTFMDGSCDPAAYILLGKTNTPRLTFSPVMGFVSLKSTAPASGTRYIKSVTLEPVGGEKMSGVFNTTNYYTAITGGTISGITISAGEGNTIPFGKTIVFAVPKGTYASGVRFKIVAVPNENGSGEQETMVFSKQTSFTVSNTSMYSLTAPAFNKSDISAPTVTTINSSTLGLSWTGANSANNKKKTWKIHMYGNSACTSELRTIEIPAEAACWTEGMTSTVNFAIGGLAKNTTYYFKVEDVKAGITSALGSGKTDAFSVVSMVASIGTSTTGTVFAEDFSELCGFGVKYNGVEYGGCINNTASKMLDPTDWASVSFVAPEDYDWKLYSSDLDAGVSGKRLAGWLSESQAIAKCGYLQLGSADAKGWVLTPAFTLASGYMAKVNVTVNAANYDGSTIDHSIAVVRAGNFGSGSAARESDFTWVSTPDPALYDEKNPGEIVWQNITASLYLRNGDRIEFGSAKTPGNTNQRILMNSIKVEVVEVVPEADYLISCYERLKDYMDAVGTSAGSGTKAATGLVTHDITLTSAQKTSLASSYPLAGYTGTLDGGSKTITGLTQSFFADLQGTVKNLTLNSTINRTADVEGSEGPAIFAETSTGTITNCTAQGSVTYQPSTAVTNATRYVAGVVGLAASGSTLTNCTNQASISVPSNSQTNSLILHLGGVVGRIKITDSDHVGNLTNSGNISCGITNERSDYIGGIVGTNNSDGAALANCTSAGGTITYNGSHTAVYSEDDDCDLYIGGIVGYSKKAISSCTSAMTINVGGSFTPSRNMYYATGGIVGSMSANQSISNCLNTGAITVSQQIKGSYGYNYLGGLAGRTEGSISDSSNGGKVTFTGSNAAQDPRIGGLVGMADYNTSRSITGKYSSASATNYGEVEVNTSKQSKKYVYVGGVVGENEFQVNATNAGQINVNRLTCTALYLGGIVGHNKGIVLSGTENLASGDISVSNLTAKGYRGNSVMVGGVVGHNYNEMTVSGNNAGDVIVNSGCTSAQNVFVGGVVGRSYGNISSSTNSGLVSNACPVTDSTYVNSNSQTVQTYLQVGGVVGYNNGTSVIDDCHNRGNVINTAEADAASYLYVGGITSEADAAVSNCDNTGNVSNSGDSGNLKPIKVGGIAGQCSVNITNCSNGTSSLAGGEISNSGTSAKHICIGGVVGGGLDGKTVSGCYNKGSVGNSGDGVILAIGGLAGWAEAATFSSACYNTGAVSNSGTASEGDGSVPGVRIGGLVGCAPGVTDLSGTSGSYHYNNGSISESSESTHVAVSGVCAFSDDTSSTFEYAQNKSNGDISIGTGDYDQVWVGGVVGLGNEPTIDHSSNAGDIVFDTVTTDQLWCGGVIGKWKDETTKTIQYCANSGTITTKTHDWATERDLYPRKYACAYSYIGGIAGGGPNRQVGKTYSNCTSSGDINIYSPICFMIGGITSAATTSAPSNCTVKASITFKRNSAAFQEEGQEKGTNNDSYVAGIVGYADLTSFSGLLFRGSIDTMSSNKVKAAGIVAYQSGGKSVTFTNCKVGGTRLRAAQSGNNMVGIFEQGTDNSKRSYTFPGCVIETGLLWDGDTDVTINSSSDVTIKMCAGPNCKLASGGTLPSVGSVTWPSIP